MNENISAHPFELAGMAIGPYRFVGLWSFPSRTLAERNPSAYNIALGTMPRNLEGGCGTCSHCGMAISNVFIVESVPTGKRFGVGCDCVQKTGDKALGDRVKVAKARHEAQLRRERAEQRRREAHERYLDTVCPKTGETNRARLACEAAERDAKQAAILAKGAVYGPIADRLADGCGGFRDSVARDLRAGRSISPRAIDIVCDILAKQVGRSGSKAYEAEYESVAVFFNTHPL